MGLYTKFLTLGKTAWTLRQRDTRAPFQLTGQMFQIDLTQKTQKYVGGIKIGLEFFSSNGPAGFLEIKKLGISVNDNSLRDIIKNGGFVRCGWDGKQETELKIKEDTKATIRCIPFNENPKGLTCIFSGNEAIHEVIFSKSY